MATQQKISTARLHNKIGREFDVLIDSTEGPNAVGRSYADAPEIDGVVIVEDAAHLKPGDMVKTKIVAADEYDLWAELKT